MIKKIAFAYILIILLVTSQSIYANPDIDRIYEVDPTPLGNVEYMRPSNDVRLNGKVIIKSDFRKDGYGRSMTVLKSEAFAAPSGKVEVLTNGKLISRRLVDRIVLGETGVGACWQNFIIIDLRGQQPYITNSFGNNPDGKFCFSIRKIKWGKKESLIYFANGTKYLYPTGEDVFGPVE